MVYIGFIFYGLYRVYVLWFIIFFMVYIGSIFYGLYRVYVLWFI